MRFVPLLAVFAALAGSAGACVNVVAVPCPGEAACAPDDDGAQAGADETPPLARDDEPVEDDAAPPAPPVDPSQPPPDEDPNGDGIVPFADPGPPPADAGQSCTEWTDCGPHYDNLNSGFDCVDGACTCDDTGQWAQACAEIGGSWSAAECFCFVNTDGAMPSTLALPPSSAAEDVTCWWTWRQRYCDPDRWVDTSYWERVCYGDDCYDEYVESGYYLDGQCYGRWVKRCTDGYEYWY